MQTSDLIVRSLEREGVEYAYGIPGEETGDLLFSLRDSSVTFVPVRHEQGAAFMADVHGRLTGDAGVCLSTLGPGATNLLTGVADAQLDKSPLVAITGQGGLERLHKESHQALDVVHMFEPVTKWNTRVSDPDTAGESVRKAFKVAEYEKPGATHLEVPEDVAAAEADAEPMATRPRVRRPDPDDASIGRAVDLLADADRPLVVAGNGAVRTEASHALEAFVNATGAPVAATYMGKGALSDADERSLMTLDSGEDEQARDAIAMADVVVTVGYDIAEHDPADWNPGGTPVVHLDSQPAEVYAQYNPEVEVVSDVAAALRALGDSVADADASFDEGWYADFRAGIVDDVAVDAAATAPFTVAGVLPLLRTAMADDDVLVSDVGWHKLAIARNFPTYEPNTCIISNGLASMGIAVPGGLAADRTVEGSVVAATGDGGFLMNAAEMETATRLGCGFAVVLFVDDNYGMVTAEQLAHRGEAFGTALANPDFVTFAESFGVPATRPETREDLAAALDDAVGAGEMRLVVVPVETPGM